MTSQKPFRCPVRQEGAEGEKDAIKSLSASPVDTRGTKLSGGGSRRKDVGGRGGRWGCWRRLLSPSLCGFRVNLSRST